MSAMQFVSARRVICTLAGALALFCAAAAPASAQDRLCDPAYEDCRTPLLNLIKAETVGIDVAFWYMEDKRYSDAIIARHRAGVPVRIIVDPRANSTYKANETRLAELKAAGIPMRRRTASGILHWKMMLFAGQGKIEFSGANYSPWAFVPVTPYQNYTDEVIYFTDEPSIIESFKTKFEDLWTDTTAYANYANISGPLTRRYPIYTKDPELNFPPKESYRSRALSRYRAETVGIDVIMFRITDRRHTDEMIATVKRGVPVRLITEPQQYRDPTRYWHSWNVDRLYMAGVQVRHSAHQGVNHQKTVILHGQGLTIFGSSNWTSPSSDSQEEHNLFSRKPYFYNWLTTQFERKWNNTGPSPETQPFTPLPPDTPVNKKPANGALNQGTSVTLQWHAGFFAHLYDVYVGTSPSSLQRIATNVNLGPSTSASDYKKYTLTNLAPGTTYYWKVVSKTMAYKTRSGPVWSFTTGGTVTPPPAGGQLGPGDILVHASKATLVGTWQSVADATAASGRRIVDPDRGAAKLQAPLASPPSYFEVTFEAEAGRPYRIWIRGKAASNNWANDSIYLQFSGSVNAAGQPIWRIGTTGAAVINLEDCSGCGLSGWGWQDNGWGVGVYGTTVQFASSGTQRLRVHSREDGLSIDQILLSPSKFINTPPGALKNDTTLYPESGSGSTPPPQTSASEVVIHAGKSGTLVGSWRRVADGSAAGGTSALDPDAGVPQLNAPLANPPSYAEYSFNAKADTPYRLWIRGKASGDKWSNDSVFVQFARSVDHAGDPVWRIGTTQATVVGIMECSGCGLSGWGWQDNGWGLGVLGPLVYFAVDGQQTIRIQSREDGLAIDQIVLSPQKYLQAAPGPSTNDSTILPESDGA